MKTITICQPYAELILLGQKRVENRVWRANYCGPLLIHAGKSRTWLDSYEPLPAHMDFGGLVGICDLVACFSARAIREKRVPEKYRELANHVHVEGPYCWVLENVVRFPSMIAFRGQQNLFDVPEELIVATLQAMAAAGTIDPEIAVRWLAGVAEQ